MKKIFKYLTTAALAAAAAAQLSACGGNEPDYCDYISELRHEIYLYEDDDIGIQVHLSSRETPYLTDGYKGEMDEICEIFVKFSQNIDGVTAKIGQSGGEMNYMSVTDSYYLSFTAGETGDSVQVTLTYGGADRNFDLPSALYEGVIAPETALECVRQYDADTFAALTEGKNFKGEIYVRLLADGGKCYYYVGVTDRDGNTRAYLVDGESGNIIAEREHDAR